MMTGWSQTKLETEGHTSQRTTWHMFIVANSKEPNIHSSHLIFSSCPCSNPIGPPSLECHLYLLLPKKRNCLAQAPITAFSFMLKRTMDLGFCLCKFPCSAMFFLTLILLLEEYGTIIIHCVDVQVILLLSLLPEIVSYISSLLSLEGGGDTPSFHPLF